MATEIPFGEPVPAVEAEPDEGSITTSLARLQEMHVALRHLRETIPRVMDSVLVDPPTPEQLHSHFAQAATGAAQDIKSFALTMEDACSKDAMEKARESRANNPKEISAWLVTEQEDWLDVKEGASEDVDMDREDAEGNAPSADFKVEDVQAELEKFKESHHGIEASFEESRETIKVFLPSPAYIHFEIRPKASAEGHGSYNVDSKEKTKLHKSILEAIAVRPKLNDLGLLFDMLASYADIKSRPCVKCSRLLDQNAHFPVVRSRKRTKQVDGQYVNQWEASHVACN